MAGRYFLLHNEPEYRSIAAAYRRFPIFGYHGRHHERDWRNARICFLCYAQAGYISDFKLPENTRIKSPAGRTPAPKRGCIVFKFVLTLPCSSPPYKTNCSTTISHIRSHRFSALFLQHVVNLPSYSFSFDSAGSATCIGSSSPGIENRSGFVSCS